MYNWYDFFKRSRRNRKIVFKAKGVVDYSFMLQPLEARVLYDAAVGAELASALTGLANHAVDVDIVTTHDLTNTAVNHLISEQAQTDNHGLLAAADHAADKNITVNTQSTQSTQSYSTDDFLNNHNIATNLNNYYSFDKAQVKEVIFVDNSVSNYVELLKGVDFNNLLSGKLEVVILDSHTSGVDQITDYLNQFDRQIDAVHIVSHGNVGMLNLGTDLLNDANLSHYQSSLTDWSHSFTSSQSNLLLYGCSVAQGLTGQHFIQELHDIVNVGIAASTDSTGGTALGGNWTLEYNNGQITAHSAFNTTVANNYSNVLGVITVTTTMDISDGDTSSITNLLNNLGADGYISLREAIEAANNTAGQDTIVFTGLSGTITLGGTSMHITSSDLIIDGTTALGYVNGAPTITIDLTTNAGLNDGAIGIYGSLSNIAIKGLNFSNGIFNVLGNNADDLTNFTFDHNIVSSGTGVFLNTSANLAITNNVFYGNTTSFSSISINATNNSLINNNEFYGATNSFAIHADKMTDSIISNNNIHNTHSGIIFTGIGNTNILITNNIVHHTTQGGAVQGSHSDDSVEISQNSFYNIYNGSSGSIYDPANQETPILGSATQVNNAGTEIYDITGNTLTGIAGHTYRIEFYASPAQPTGFGYPSIGQLYLGSTTITTPTSSPFSFDATVPATILPGLAITATATDITTPGAYRTSAFSAPYDANSGQILLTNYSQVLHSINVTTLSDVSDGTTTSLLDLYLNPGADGYISLREAIEAANNGLGQDTINFTGLAGTIALNGDIINITASDLTIDGTTALGYANGSPTIAIDSSANANAAHRVIQLNGSSLSNITIRGLEFSGSISSGSYVISGDYASNLSNFNFDYNVVTSGEAVFVAYSSDISITNNVLYGNSTVNSIIYAEEVSNLLISNNEIYGSTQYGIALIAINNSILSNNTIHDIYSGIFIINSDVLINNNIIHDTTQSGAVYMIGSSNTVELSQNSFYNIAPTASSAIVDSLDQATPILTDATQINNGPIPQEFNINGNLTGLAGHTYRIEFFASVPVADFIPASGQLYLGNTTITTPTISPTNFNIIVPFTTLPGIAITATATDITTPGSYTTSAFAPPGSQYGGQILLTNYGYQPINSVTVNTLSDVSDGTTTSLLDLYLNPGIDGNISLREAITAANNQAGANTIDFSVAGTISLNSTLEITDQVTINGASAPGYNTSGALPGNFDLNSFINTHTTAADRANNLPGNLTPGSVINTSDPTINITSSNYITFLTFKSGSGGSIVQGLELSNYGPTAITNEGNGAITVQNNYIHNRNDDVGQETAILMYGSGNNNIIKNNIIQGGDYAINLGNSNSNSNQISFNTITGDTVSGFKYGLSIVGSNFIYFNNIDGTDPNGPYLQRGIEFNSSPNTEVVGNDIHHVSSPILLGDTNTSGMVFYGNTIHDFSTGIGLYSNQGTSNLTIGGTGAFQGNQFYNADPGSVALSLYNMTGSSTISGNTFHHVWVATDFTFDNSSITISNNIMHDVYKGATTYSSTGLVFTQNSVYDLNNSFSGASVIDIGNNGATVNDFNDFSINFDSAQNYPIITQAILNGNYLYLTGTINSIPGTFTIEFYASPNNGRETKIYLGSTNVTTAPNNDASFYQHSIDISSQPSLSGYYITATATNQSSGYNTSEVSESVGISPVSVTDDQIFIDEDTSAISQDLLINDIIAPGVPIIASVTQGLHGTVIINPDYTINYIPNPDFYGQDTFTYTAQFGSEQRTGNVTVNIGPVDDIATDNINLIQNANPANSGFGNYEFNVLTNDSFEGTPTIDNFSQGLNGGVVNINPDGSLSYIAPAGYYGIDQFNYTVISSGAYEGVLVTVNIQHNSPIQNDQFTTTANSTAVNLGNVLTNDSFMNPARAVTGYTQGVNGGIVAIDASGNITYTPLTNYTGSDNFSYTVTTTNGIQETGTVNITINPVPPTTTVTGSSSNNQALISTIDTDTTIITTAENDSSTNSSTNSSVGSTNIITPSTDLTGNSSTTTDSTNDGNSSQSDSSATGSSGEDTSAGAPPDDEAAAEEQTTETENAEQDAEAAQAVTVTASAAQSNAVSAANDTSGTISEFDNSTTTSNDSSSISQTIADAGNAIADAVTDSVNYATNNPAVSTVTVAAAAAPAVASGVTAAASSTATINAASTAATQAAQAVSNASSQAANISQTLTARAPGVTNLSNFKGTNATSSSKQSANQTNEDGPNHKCQCAVCLALKTTGVNIV